MQVSNKIVKLPDHDSQFVEQLEVLRRVANQGFEEIDQGKGVRLTSATSLQRHLNKLGRLARNE